MFVSVITSLPPMAPFPATTILGCYYQQSLIGSAFEVCYIHKPPYLPSFQCETFYTSIILHEAAAELPAGDVTLSQGQPGDYQTEKEEADATAKGKVPCWGAVQPTLLLRAGQLAQGAQGHSQLSFEYSWDGDSTVSLGHLPRCLTT